ncbi:hypothetical protein GCK32_012914, partial [Trichostrongylus colubriformis]
SYPSPPDRWSRKMRVLDEIFSEMSTVSSTQEGPTSEFELLNIRLMIFEPGPFKTIKRSSTRKNEFILVYVLWEQFKIDKNNAGALYPRKSREEAMLGNGDTAEVSKEAVFNNCNPEDLKEAELFRALPIRIKSMYNCEEQRVVSMAPPFRGFSALVRFQCRARMHKVERINVKDLDAQSSPMEENKQN